VEGEVGEARRPDLAQEHGDAVHEGLRADDLAGHTITLKVRYGDFSTVSRSRSVDGYVDDASAILAVATGLLDGLDLAGGVRLLGVGIANLREGAGQQLSLDFGTHPRDRHAAAEAVDAVRARFGHGAIGPARLAGSDGLDTFEHGAQQWGPSAGT